MTTRERELTEALRGCLDAMDMQEKRESGAYHIPSETALCVWRDAETSARAVLDKGSAEPASRSLLADISRWLEETQDEDDEGAAELLARIRAVAPASAEPAPSAEAPRELPEVIVEAIEAYGSRAWGSLGRLRARTDLEDAILAAPSPSPSREDARNEALEEAAKECLTIKARLGVGVDAEYFAKCILALKRPTPNTKEQ